MCSTEHLRKTAWTVQQILKPAGAHHPLSMVITPNDLTGERYECSQKAELEKACLAEAGWRFTQAWQTPFLTSPLLEIFGEKGQTKAFDQVLAGTFQPPPKCNLYMAKFLAQLSRPPTITEVFPWSTQDFCWGWQRAQESTGLSASGIHFGHYIAGTFNPEILVVNATLANIPLCTGFTYDRWKKGINVMIEKTCGDFNVEK